MELEDEEFAISAKELEEEKKREKEEQAKKVRRTSPPPLELELIISTLRTT